MIRNNSVFNATSSAFSSDRGFESRFENNTCENSYIGINLVLNAEYNYFKNNVIRNSSIGIRFEHWGSDNNNVFKDMNLSNSSQYAVYFESGSGSVNNTFINVTYNLNKEIMLSSSELASKWYLDVNVKDTNGIPISNANVSAYDVNGTLKLFVLTNSNGSIGRQEVVEYINNAGIKTYYTNYTIKITKTEYNNYSTTLNVSDNKFLSVTLLSVCPAGMVGYGTSENPCVITNCTQLQAMNENLSAHYKIGININCSNTINWNAGAGFSPVGHGDVWNVPYIPFTGSLDGNDKNITGLYINGSSSTNAGLFGSMQNAIIRNVHLRVNITGKSNYVGALGGWSQGTVITNCSSTGTVSATLGNVGGLVGRIEGTSIYDSYSEADVFAGGGGGGLVGFCGHLEQDTIERCFATGNVTALGDGAGGLVASINTATIMDCFATGNVLGNNIVGGLIGETNGGNIYNSYATGNVSGNTDVGGLVGQLGRLGGGFYGASGIYDSYSTGCVSGTTNVGGLVGLVGWDSPVVNNSGWWTGSGPTYAIGSISENITYNEANKSAFYSSSHAVYHSTPSWNFKRVWRERDKDYPILKGFEYLFHVDCNCSSCEECNKKLNHTSCSIIILNAGITNQTGTCIDNPLNFNNKIFDCQGYVIDGDDSGNDYGIYLNDRQNNTIKNCIITDFYDGIYLYYYSNNNTLINNTANSNYYGIDLDYHSNNNTLINNTANSNNDSGIILYYSSNNLINFNSVCSNINYDFYSSDWLSSFGSNNTCDKAEKWNDTDATNGGCINKCQFQSIGKATNIFDMVEMLEYLSGDKNFTQLSHHDIQGYYKFVGSGDINLLDVLALIDNIVIEG
ncbi:hypothetical protein MSIBF_A3030005 [groundwater metagenome]|uniref:Uncharacterized protein n=1 Tax=groundwater metagenome TaxID=717931 RepID=A0A098EBU7_9ZZZZ